MWNCMKRRIYNAVEYSQAYFSNAFFLLIIEPDVHSLLYAGLYIVAKLILIPHITRWVTNYSCFL
jgi:hypothetical protein